MKRKRIQRGISRRTACSRQADRDDCRGPKRTYDEGLIDRVELCKMDIFRTSQAELARQLSSLRPYTVTQQTISRDLKIIKAEFFYTKNLHRTDPELFKTKLKNSRFMSSWLKLNKIGPY